MNNVETGTLLLIDDTGISFTPNRALLYRGISSKSGKEFSVMIVADTVRLL